MQFIETPDYPNDTFLVRGHHLPGLRSWLEHSQDHELLTPEEFDDAYREFNSQSIAAVTMPQRKLFGRKQQAYAQDLMGTSSDTIDLHVAATYNIYRDFMTMADTQPAAVVVDADRICLEACIAMRHCGLNQSVENKFLMNFIKDAEDVGVDVATDTLSFASTTLGGLKRTVLLRRDLLVIE